MIVMSEREINLLGLIVGLALLGALAIGAVAGYKFGYNSAVIDNMVTVGPYPPPLSVDVREGETIWSIAQKFYDEDMYNIVKVVDVIQELNPHLVPTKLKVGDNVKLPRHEELEVALKWTY